MTSRILKGGIDPVKEVKLDQCGRLFIDGHHVATSTSVHMAKANAEYCAWKYNLQGYTDAVDGFVTYDKFKYKKYWPVHWGY